MIRKFRKIDGLLYFLVLLLIISSIIHLKNIDDSKKYNDYLLKEYAANIDSGSAFLNDAVTSPNEDTESLILSSLSSIELAYQAAANLGNHSNKYALSNNVEVYVAVPWEIRSLIEQAREANLRGNELERVSTIVSIYKEKIELNTIREPDDYYTTYQNIHKVINQEEMVENLESVNFEKTIK